jgi:hypothetical protein
MSQLQAFEQIPIEKKIPSSAKILEMLGSQNLIKERYTVTQNPYAGSTISTAGPVKVTHKLFNNADYLDGNTAYMTFDVLPSVAGGANMNNLQFDDNILSIFNIYRGLVNDRLVEEITNFNLFVNLLTYATMSKSNYESSATFFGCYRHSSNISTGGPIGALLITGGTDPTVAFTNPSNFGGGVPFTPVSTSGLSPNDVYAHKLVLAQTSYSVPLAGFIGLCSLEKFIPLRNLGSITLEFYMQPANGCVYNNGYVNTVAPSLVIQVLNQNMNFDCIRFSDAYYELMDDELMGANGAGASFVINTYECTPNSVVASGGNKNLLISKGTKYLKSIYAVFQPTAWAGSVAIPSNSCFPTMAYQSHSFLVNSKRYPQLKCQGLPQAFQELQKSTNKFASIVGDSIITREKYSLNQTTGTVARDTALACFILGQNFEQIIESGVQLTGLDTNTAGYQIQLEVNNTPDTPTTCYAFVHFAKILKIANGSVEVQN